MTTPTPPQIDTGYASNDGNGAPLKVAFDLVNAVIRTLFAVDSGLAAQLVDALTLIEGHINDHDNPHQVTAAQLQLAGGILGDPMALPISTATGQAIGVLSGLVTQGLQALDTAKQDRLALLDVASPGFAAAFAAWFAAGLRSLPKDDGADAVAPVPTGSAFLTAGGAPQIAG